MGLFYLSKKIQRAISDMGCPENVIPHQYKPGQSGNPKGKPKGTLSFKTVIKQLLELEEIDESGDRIANIVAMTKKVMDRAKKGDIRAYEVLADRAEGKPVQKVENKHEGGISLFLEGAEKRAAELKDENADGRNQEED